MPYKQFLSFPKNDVLEIFLQQALHLNENKTTMHSYFLFKSICKDNFSFCSILYKKSKCCINKQNCPAYMSKRPKYAFLNIQNILSCSLTHGKQVQQNSSYKNVKGSNEKLLLLVKHSVLVYQCFFFQFEIYCK